jgi:hypothetical protein
MKIGPKSADKVRAGTEKNVPTRFQDLRKLPFIALEWQGKTHPLLPESPSKRFRAFKAQRNILQLPGGHGGAPYKTILP